MDHFIDLTEDDSPVDHDIVHIPPMHHDIVNIPPMDHEIVEIHDDDNMGDNPYTVVPPATPKKELWGVLNSFQYSPNFGVYICQKFKDPRRTQIDDYWNDVKSSAVGIHETGCCIGRINDPVSDQAKAQFRVLEKELRSIADRIKNALA